MVEQYAALLQKNDTWQFSSKHQKNLEAAGNNVLQQNYT